VGSFIIRYYLADFLFIVSLKPSPSHSGLVLLSPINMVFLVCGALSSQGHLNRRKKEIE